MHLAQNGNWGSCEALLYYLGRFGCYASRRIPEPQRTDRKIGALSKPACIMVGYLHSSTTWRIWDPESKSEVVFDEA